MTFIIRHKHSGNFHKMVLSLNPKNKKFELDEVRRMV